MIGKVDQSNYVGSTTIGFGDTLNGRDYMSNGFIPTLNYVTGISFYTNSKDGSSDVGYLIWIDNADVNSNPQGTVGVGIGGATIITNKQIQTGGLSFYKLNSPVAVTPGSRYCFVMCPWSVSSNSKANSYHDFVSSTAKPYANGRRVHLDGSFLNPSAPDSGNDNILFEVVGTNTINGSPEAQYRYIAVGNGMSRSEGAT